MRAKFRGSLRKDQNGLALSVPVVVEAVASAVVVERAAVERAVVERAVVERAVVVLLLAVIDRLAPFVVTMNAPKKVRLVDPSELVGVGTMKAVLSGALPVVVLNESAFKLNKNAWVR